VRALPVRMPGTLGTGGPLMAEGRLWPLVLAVCFALGPSWGFLPSGLQFDPSAREAASEAGGISGLFALQWMPLILVGLVAIVFRLRLATLAFRDLNPWAVALPLWAMVSLIWAPDSFRVLKQSFGVGGVMLLALGFTLYGWHADRYQTVLRPLVTWALVLSLLAGILVPDIGIHHEQQFELDGSWRGITYQKNGLGQLSALGVILWFYAWASRTETALKAGMGVGLAVLMTLLSRSSTSLLLSLICCGVILLRLRPPLRMGGQGAAATAAGWLLVLVPLFLYLIFVGSLDGQVISQSFAEIFGKDATFSGRTLIWAEVLRVIESQPLVGVGFNSFWHTAMADETIQRLGWPCPSGHNGYLDVWLTLGLVGLSMLLMMLVRQFADLSRLAQVDRNRAALHTAILLYVMLANLTESGWFVPMAFTHVIAVYSSVCVSRLLFDARVRAVVERQARQLATAP